MSKLTANRAYRVTKDFDVAGFKPAVDSVVYLESAFKGKATIVFAGGASQLFRLKLSESELAYKAVLAKFITLPDQLKVKYLIDANGQRVRFDRGNIYEVPNATLSLPSGTKMRCIIGGQTPLMAYVDLNGTAKEWEPRNTELMKLKRIDPVPDTTAEIKLDVKEIKNAFPGCRPAFTAQVSFGSYEISLSRKPNSSTVAIKEVLPGSQAAIETILRENLGRSTAAKSASSAEIIEAFVSFRQFDCGVVTFESAVDRLVRLFKDENKHSASVAAQKAVQKELDAQNQGTTSRNGRPDNKGGAYRKLLQSQYGFR